MDFTRSRCSSGSLAKCSWPGPVLDFSRDYLQLIPQDELTNTIVPCIDKGQRNLWTVTTQSANQRNAEYPWRDAIQGIQGPYPSALPPRPPGQMGADTSPVLTNEPTQAVEITFPCLRNMRNPTERTDVSGCEQDSHHISTPLSQADGAPQVNCFALRFTASRCSLARVAEAGDSGGIFISI